MGFDKPQLIADLKTSFAGPPATRNDSADEIGAAIDDNYTDVATGFASQVVARRIVVQPIPNNDWTDMVFSTENVDTGGEYDHTTGIFTAGSAGFYAASWSVALDSAPWPAVARRFIAAASRNNATTESNFWYGVRWAAQAIHTGASHSVGSAIVFLAATNTLRIKVIQNQGAPVNSSAQGLSNYFHIHRLS